MRMHRGRILKLRERVTGQPIGPALQDEELRRVLFQMRFYRRPGLHELTIARTRRQFDVELGAGGGARASLVGAPAAGKQRATVLMQVGDDYPRVGFKAVEHPIAMMGVDIDIGDPLDAMPPASVSITTSVS